MANNKIGFEYYNTDTNRYQDIKIKRLKKEFGCSGIAIYDYILCEIYRVKGCFLLWDENTAFDVAEYFGIKESLVNEVVAYCCFVGLFDKELLSSGKILTSLSIQKRYIEMCNRAKRLNSKIPEQIKLLEESDIIHEKSTKHTEESGQNSYSLPQSKVEESKVKESKELNEFGNSLILSEENLRIEFSNSFSVIESCMKLYKISEEVVIEYFDLFVTEQKTKDNLNRSFKEIKEHFGSWLRIRIETQKKTGQKESVLEYNLNQEKRLHDMIDNMNKKQEYEQH